MRLTAVFAILVGTIGGYFVARYAGGDQAFVLVAFAVWWLLTAFALARLVRGTDVVVAVVTLFLVIWLGVPLVVAGVAYGYSQLIGEAIEDAFEDFDVEGSTGDTGQQ